MSSKVKMPHPYTEIGRFVDDRKGLYTAEQMQAYADSRVAEARKAAKLEMLEDMRTVLDKHLSPIGKAAIEVSAAALKEVQ